MPDPGHRLWARGTRLRRAQYVFTGPTGPIFSNAYIVLPVGQRPTIAAAPLADYDFAALELAQWSGVMPLNAAKQKFEWHSGIYPQTTGDGGFGFYRIYGFCTGVFDEIYFYILASNDPVFAGGSAIPLDSDIFAALAYDALDAPHQRFTWNAWQVLDFTLSGPVGGSVTLFAGG